MTWALAAALYGLLVPRAFATDAASEPPSPSHTSSPSPSKSQAADVVAAAATASRADASHSPSPSPSPSPSLDPPLGPPFGTTRYRAEIAAPRGGVSGGEPDSDVFETALLEGELLSVAVTAEPETTLRPVLRLTDPLGVERTPGMRVARGGAGLSFDRFAVDSSGRWRVEVRGAPGTHGGYGVRFGVRPAPTIRLRAQRVGGVGAPREREHRVPGAVGATLDLSLRSRRGGERAVISAVTGADGAPVAFGLPRDRGRVASLRRIPLAQGDGAYTVAVAVEDGTAEYDLRVRVRPPSRPRGVHVLGEEPRLAALAEPLPCGVTQSVWIPGGGFSVHPLPQVWVGGLRAWVIDATPVAVRVVPPLHPEGDVVGVTVVHPDGQAARRDGVLVYRLPAPPRLVRVHPASLSVYAGRSAVMEVQLDRTPGGAGLEVAVGTTGGVGTTTPSAAVAPSLRSGTFAFTAGDAPGEGTVVARLGDTVVSAHVRVVALPPASEGPPPPLPDEADLSGWTLHQANSARVFTFPPGTRLVAGDVVVIGRAATQESFEAFWGRTLAPNVRYLTADPTNTGLTSDDWPSINGGETFELRDAAGATVDGPTVAMATAGGEGLQRIARRAAMDPLGWVRSLAPNTTSSPGEVPAPDPSDEGAPAPPLGVRISEFADVTGSGHYVFEFVELHFDGSP